MRTVLLLFQITSGPGNARGWNQGMGAVSVDHARFEGVHSDANRTGFYIGRNGSARDCEAGGNASCGFVFDTLAEITDCSASTDTSYGILAQTARSFSACVRCGFRSGDCEIARIK